MFLDFDAPLGNKDFISIVILSYTRPKHLRNLMESIHQYADMPFEIVVHDDASPPDLQDQVYILKPYMSSVTFGTGINMGFSAAANRATALANSEYVLLLNDDMLLLGPCFQQTKKALDIPFVGCYGPGDPDNLVEGAPSEGHVVINYNDINLRLGSCGGMAGGFAFRKSLWTEMGGFPQVYGNGGDISFYFKLLQNGYFNAGPVGVPQAFQNVDRDEGSKNANAGRTSGHDQSYPHIFGIPDDAYRQVSHQRRERRHEWSHNQYLKRGGIHNISFWNDYFEHAKSDDKYSYEWSKIEEFGQAKWKDEIEKGVTIWKNLGKGQEIL